ncbi:MAG: glutamate racemase [Candidatus Omnitrophica bacterium]|nr:glutamate racemase [Candidatus Omnitrophota bacterium]
MILEKNKPIGVFDSGVGGLTVVKSLCEKLPYENIVYFGDTARVPYGNKSRNTIKRFSEEIVAFLLKKKVKMIVIACNTASSLAVDHLKKKFKLPILGVIEAGVEEALINTGNKKIGVIGTNSTVKSGAYERLLLRKESKACLVSRSCPLFVPLVENGMIRDRITQLIVERYLREFNKNGVDTLILGCTHYPVLKKVIQKVLPNVTLIDSASAVAKKTEFILKEKKLASNGDRGFRVINCFVSDAPGDFKRNARIFFAEDINVSKAMLEQ